MGCIVVLVGLFYGAGDEFHQTFVPGRNASVADLIADGVGSYIGAVIALVVARRLRTMPKLYPERDIKI